MLPNEAKGLLIAANDLQEKAKDLLQAKYKVLNIKSQRFSIK